MATSIGGSVLTLLDLAKRSDPTGKSAKIVEMLSQSNEILSDMLWLQGNLPTGHRTTLRTSLPSVSWRALNQGTAPSKSTTTQVTESCAMLEAWSEVDCDLANMSGDVSAFRLSEAQAFIEAMSQEMAQTIFYGDASTAPEEFNGLSVRYASTTAANGQNVIKAGGSGTDNMSIWLIIWGEQTIHGIVPQGSTAGLKHENLGEVTIETTAGVAGSRMRAYQDRFSFHCGLSVRDWRYGVRICNIDESALTSKSSAADLIELMIKATHRIPSLQAGRAAFYMNRTTKQMLDIQKRDDVQTGGQLGYNNIDGVPVMTFRGIPIRTCDALLNAEGTAIS